MAERRKIALIAHDKMKLNMAEFALKHQALLQPFQIVATGTTGTRVAEACPGLNITRMKSGPLGGDQQIGAMIAQEEVALLIFLVDPLTPMPHDVDVKALMRLAILYDTPMALNLASADILLPAIAR
ncbi:methylglyoxal synthase [Allorhizobium sp. BGMRC 0089]|uniref:methylglyoxal synthase n=1 Tax=Allorhizobium sonneratiae TaxID=2934936 RepID=UPI0020338FA6|nr:methylglyoxal synthase [Allorhizobium sonneratiae]MCM2291775.1 methylglyoxal synthase [Allorhizobium sonneratiae]